MEYNQCYVRLRLYTDVFESYTFYINCFESLLIICMVI